MARLNPRGAAVVGVVSLFLLVGGPGMAMVTADPGGSRGGGSDRGSSADRGDSKSNHNHRGDRHDFDRGRRGDDRDNNGGWNRAGSDGPQSRVGSGRELPQQAAPNAPAGVAARAPVSEEPPRANAPAISERSAIASSPPVEAPAPVIPAPETGATGTDGSEPVAGPANTFEAPRVIVGNGREPGLQSTDPAPRWQGPAPGPAVAPPAPAPVAPPPPPPEPPRWLHHFSAPPAMPRHLPAAPTTDWKSLWGLVGLLLIPAAGAALGYRQARAAQTADRIHRP
ncbi:hypothetical protein ABQE44_07010 [Mycolicibacterium sp. XJ2546]